MAEQTLYDGSGVRVDEGDVEDIIARGYILNRDLEYAVFEVVEDTVYALLEIGDEVAAEYFADYNLSEESIVPRDIRPGQPIEKLLEDRIEEPEGDIIRPREELLELKDRLETENNRTEATGYEQRKATSD